MRLQKGLLVALLAGAFVFTSCKCERKGGTDAVGAVEAAGATVAGAAAAAGDALEDGAEAVGDAVSNATDKVKEAFTFGDGISINAFKGGIEDQMIKYLNSGDYADADDEDLKSKWYDFDNIQFVFGKTDELEEGSEVQLENISEILKAFPESKIKIGAYTDKKGSDAVNKDISQKRADYIKQRLSELGVGEQITGAEGYGSEFATVPEDASDEERAADRKMSLRFSKS